jgi:predicted  nucleic acid-binding Zn-ribbon protein
MVVFQLAQVSQSPALANLSLVLEALASAVGVGIAAYVLVETKGRAVFNQFKEVKNLSNRNNENIVTKANEIKDQAQDLKQFVDTIQKHQARNIDEANKKVSLALDALAENTEITKANQARIARLEDAIASYQTEVKEITTDIRGV